MNIGLRPDGTIPEPGPALLLTIGKMAGGKWRGELQRTSLEDFRGGSGAHGGGRIHSGQRDQLRIATPSMSQPARNLSDGNQQKVVICKWLMAKSRILFLDEPTQGVDGGAKEEIHRLMIDFTRRQRGTLVIISSDLPEVLRMSERILVMRAGRIVAELAGALATEEAVMAHAFGVADQERTALC